MVSGLQRNLFFFSLFLLLTLLEWHQHQDCGWMDDDGWGPNDGSKVYSKKWDFFNFFCFLKVKNKSI